MSKFQVDPKIQMVVVFVVGVITFLGTNALPAEVPPHVATAVHDWSVWIGQLYMVVIAPLLLAFTNSNPGPLAPPDSAAVKAVIAKEDAKNA